MPNGTGKTTTLTMLRAALSGSAKEWNSEKIRELRRSGDSATFGQFVVKIAVNNNPLTFELKLYFERGKVEYRTSYGTGIREGFFPPAPLMKFRNSEFVNLFVFDGELASNLLDPKQTRAAVPLIPSSNYLCWRKWLRRFRRIGKNTRNRLQPNLTRV